MIVIEVPKATADAMSFVKGETVLSSVMVHSMVRSMRYDPSHLKKIPPLGYGLALFDNAGTFVCWLEINWETDESATKEIHD